MLLQIQNYDSDVVVDLPLLPFSDFADLFHGKLGLISCFFQTFLDEDSRNFLERRCFENFCDLLSAQFVP